MSRVYGLEMPGEGLPEGWIPLEAVVVLKCLNDEGRATLYLNRSDGLTDFEQLGMLSAARRTTEDDCNAQWRDRGGEDEDE